MFPHIRTANALDTFNSFNIDTIKITFFTKNINA